MKRFPELGPREQQGSKPRCHLFTDCRATAVRVAEWDLVEAQARTKPPKPVVEATPPTDIADHTDVVGRVKLLVVSRVDSAQDSRFISDGTMWDFPH